MRRCNFFVLCFFGFISVAQTVWATKPLKIVSLTPVISEWVAEILGKDQSLQRVIGVSEYSNYPSYLTVVPTIGPYPQLHVEKIAALHPDLVIGSLENNRSDQIEKLKRLHLRVELLPAEKFQDLEKWLVQLGAFLDESQKAQAAVQRWTQKIEALKKSIPKNAPSKTMMIEVQHEPLIVVGGKTFLDDAFSMIKYQNVFGNLDQSYPKVSKEAVFKENPDVIFIFDMLGVEAVQKMSEKDWQKFENLKAVRRSHLQRISGDDFARCSMRLLDGLKRIVDTDNLAVELRLNR